MLDRISVVMITKDAADTIRESLESAAQFSEIVVFDNGSQDDTMEIARGYGNVSLHQGEFTGFGPTKNHAVSLARHDWVLSLDADEKVSPELADELSRWAPGDDHVAGIIRRDNYLMGRLVKRGGWGNDWLFRLFNRKVHRFNDNAVHESVQLTATSKRQRFKSPIQHNAVQHLGQFLVKINRYSEIRRETSSKTFPPFIIFLRSLFTFFRSYVLKGGFLAGWRGLVIAWSNSCGTFFKYMKVYADRHP